MSPELPELSSEPYVPESGEIRGGDVCRAVALLDLEEPRLVTSDDLPGRLLAAVKISHVVVTALYDGYATVAPVALAGNVEDGDALATLVESSSHERRWLRLPPLPGEWEKDGVALFFLTQTVRGERLTDRRAASMREQDAQVLAGRFAIAFSADAV